MEKKDAVFTAEERAQMLRRRQEGETNREIARGLGRPLAEINQGFGQWRRGQWAPAHPPMAGHVWPTVTESVPAPATEVPAPAAVEAAGAVVGPSAAPGAPDPLTRIGLAPDPTSPARGEVVNGRGATAGNDSRNSLTSFPSAAAPTPPSPGNGGGSEGAERVIAARELHGLAREGEIAAERMIGARPAVPLATLHDCLDAIARKHQSILEAMADHSDRLVQLEGICNSNYELLDRVAAEVAAMKLEMAKRERVADEAGAIQTTVVAQLVELKQRLADIETAAAVARGMEAKLAEHAIEFRHRLSAIEDRAAPPSADVTTVANGLAELTGLVEALGRRFDAAATAALPPADGNASESLGALSERVSRLSAKLEELRRRVLIDAVISRGHGVSFDGTKLVIDGKSETWARAETLAAAGTHAMRRKASS